MPSSLGGVVEDRVTAEAIVEVNLHQEHAGCPTFVLDPHYLPSQGTTSVALLDDEGHLNMCGSVVGVLERVNDSISTRPIYYFKSRHPSTPFSRAVNRAERCCRIVYTMQPLAIQHY